MSKPDLCKWPYPAEVTIPGWPTHEILWRLCESQLRKRVPCERCPLREQNENGWPRRRRCIENALLLYKIAAYQLPVETY